MSRTKNALSFVGKSVAFSLIAGVIWSGIVMVFANIGASGGQSPSSGASNNAAVAEQIENYNKQMEATQAQLARSEELQTRTAKLLDAEERLNAEQERLQKRFSAILDKWEKTATKCRALTSQSCSQPAVARLAKAFGLCSRHIGGVSYGKGKSEEAQRRLRVSRGDAGFARSLQALLLGI